MIQVGDNSSVEIDRKSWTPAYILKDELIECAEERQCVRERKDSRVTPKL